MIQPPSINSGYVLLVEGRDEEYVVRRLVRSARIPDSAISSKPKDGIERLLDSLTVELRGSELHRLGIILDADEDALTRWQGLSARLSAAGYTNLPATPPAGGLVLSPSDVPHVGVWIMPDNSTSGMLEDFLATCISPGDLLWPRARECVDAIPTPGRPFAANRLPKVYLHTWLAWQEEPGLPFGLAIAKSYLNPDSQTAQQFIQWLRRLFSLP